MSRRYELIILCEDNQQEYFVRRYFARRLNKMIRRSRTIKPSGGRGSGEQFVREGFAVELAALRKPGGSAILVVMIDADTYSVSERKKTILETIKTKDSDRFIILVPKRNIETWIYYLRHDNAEENENYKNKLGLKRERDCRQEIGKLVDGCMNRSLLASKGVPPSLKDACGEYNSLIEKM